MSAKILSTAIIASLLLAVSRRHSPLMRRRPKPTARRRRT